jgi:hypothetical protein
VISTVELRKMRFCRQGKIGEINVELRSSYSDLLVLKDLTKAEKRAHFMKFSEVLHYMAICSSQISLLEMVEDIANFAEQYKGLNFADFLKILASYCQYEGEKELEVNQTWDVVGSLLTSAAQQLEVLYVEESEPTIFTLQVIKLITECFRRMILFRMVCLWTLALEEEQCRFADILEALAEYALSAAQKNPRAAAQWRIAASIIKTAQEKANSQGQELP